MKHTSPLQQLHVLLTSSQLGHVTSDTCLLKAPCADLIHFEFNDPCSAEIFSEEGHSSNSEIKMSMSLTDRAYIQSGSEGSMRTEHSLPTLHNEALRHSIFNPFYQRTCTPTEESPTYINSIETSTSPKHAAYDSTANAIVLEERSAVTNEQTRKRSDSTGALTESHKIHYSSISPLRSIKKRSMAIKSQEIACITDHGEDLLVRRFPITKTGPTAKKNNEEIDSYSDTEIESIHVSGMKHCSRHVPLGVGGKFERPNDVSRDINQCDSAEWKTDSSNADQQICSTKSAVLTSTPTETSNLRSLCPAPSSASTRSRRQRQIEVEQVHQVYKQIAPHCDHVRQKAWPRVKRFLKDMEPGSFVADVGCGNGRYLNINTSVFKLGCDTCPPFLDQARDKDHEVVLADNIALPYRDATFDAVISIGVIHHFASLERRIRAISELSRILSPGGRLMIYVWAFEQIHRKFESQDVLIPWIKPEVKDITGRNSVSYTFQHGNNKISSKCGSAIVDDTALHTMRRYVRNERYKILNSDGDRCRSKSLGDRDSANDDYSDQSVSKYYFVVHKFGVFDRRDSIQRDSKLTRKDRIENENTVNEDAIKYENQDKSIKNVDYSEFKTTTKWPGQLFSECRKLGKILRSLTSRSDSQSNGDADPLSSTSETVDIFDDLQKESKSNPCDEKITEGIKDTSDELSTRDLKNENFNTKFETSTTLEEVGHHETAQDVCFGCGVHNPECTKINSNIVSSSQIITTTNGCSYASDDKNHISETARVYHNVEPTSNFIAHTQVSEKCTLDSEESSISSITQGVPKGDSLLVKNFKKDNKIDKAAADAAITCLQHLTSVATSNSSDKSVVMSSIAQESNTSCNHDLTERSSHEDLERFSASCITVSASENLQSGDLVSSHSDKTVTDIQHDCRNKIHTGKCLLGEQNNALEDKCVKDVLDDTQDRCISREAIHMGDFNNGVLKCQYYLAKVSSNCENSIHGHLEEETRNPVASCSNSSTEANYGASDQDDDTDCFNSDSIFSLDQDKSVGPYNESCQSREASCGDHPVTSNSTDLSQAVSAGGMTETDVENSRDTDYRHLSMSRDDLQRDTGSRNEHSHGATSTSEVTPFRVTLKSILNKLADYVRLPSRNESKTFGCYHSGNGYDGDFTLEVDSSENETPISNFSTHSSCYPGLFTASKEKARCGKNDISEQEKCENTHCIDEVGSQIISDAEASIDTNILASGDASKQLRINTLNRRETSVQDFVSDVSETIETSTKDTFKNSPSFPYKLKVENLSLAPVKKTTLFHVLTQKWSNLFRKESMDVQRQACLQYSAVSLSSSDDNGDTLNISLEVNKQPTNSENTPPNRMFTRRPNFLDFNKRRTRRKGRRPAPQRDREYRDQNINECNVQNMENRMQDVRQLTLSDAMTLLGDGAAEECIVERLDNSAKTIFAEMKRMNFAIRKFPMSSVDSDTNDDSTKESAGNPVEADTATADEAEKIKVTSLKMRRDKRIFSSHRRFSDSVTSQVIALRKRGPLQRQHDLADRETNKRVHPLQREYLSDDLVNFFDSFGIQRCRRESRLLLPRRQDNKPDLFTPLESSPKSQNISNNAQTSFADIENENATGSIKNETLFPIGFADTALDSTNDIVKGNLVKHNSLHCCDAGWSPSTTLNYTSHLCHSENINTDSITNKSGDVNNINQSYLGNEDTVTNRNTSPLILCNQSASKAPPLNSFKLNSSNENAEANICCGDFSELAGSKNKSLSRYYHVFKKGELDHLITRHVPSLKIVDTFYDHANWCIIAEKI